MTNSVEKNHCHDAEGAAKSADDVLSNIENVREYLVRPCLALNSIPSFGYDDHADFCFRRR